MIPKYLIQEFAIIIGLAAGLLSILHFTGLMPNSPGAFILGMLVG